MSKANPPEIFTSLRLYHPALAVTYNLNDLTTYLSDESDGFGMPPFHWISQRAPNQHGETYLDFRLDPRRLLFELKRSDTTVAGHFTGRSTLLQALRPFGTSLELRAYIGTDIYFLDCYIDPKKSDLRFPSSQRQA